jgi:hypothetical protein
LRIGKLMVEISSKGVDGVCWSVGRARRNWGRAKMIVEDMLPVLPLAIVLIHIAVLFVSDGVLALTAIKRGIPCEGPGRGEVDGTAMVPGGKQFATVGCSGFE